MMEWAEWIQENNSQTAIRLSLIHILRFLGLNVLAPKDSHNTDGLDPERCV